MQDKRLYNAEGLGLDRSELNKSAGLYTCRAGRCRSREPDFRCQHGGAASSTSPSSSELPITASDVRALFDKAARQISHAPAAPVRSTVRSMPSSAASWMAEAFSEAFDAAVRRGAAAKARGEGSITFRTLPVRSPSAGPVVPGFWRF